MYYNILETDEAIKDLHKISIQGYEYTRDKNAGIRFLENYSETVETLTQFPKGFRGISIEHRGYEIKIFPFANYNIFFIVREESKDVVILRVLYQKQNWGKILRIDRSYHLLGEAI